MQVPLKEIYRIVGEVSGVPADRFLLGYMHTEDVDARALMVLQLELERKHWPETKKHQAMRFSSHNSHKRAIARGSRMLEGNPDFAAKHWQICEKVEEVRLSLAA